MNIHEYTFPKEHPLSNLKTEYELLHSWDDDNLQEYPLLSCIRQNTWNESQYYNSLSEDSSNKTIEYLEYLKDYYDMIYHNTIEDYVMIKMVENSTLFKPKLDYIISLIEDVQRAIKITMKRLKDSTLNQSLETLLTLVILLLKELKRYDRNQYLNYLEETKEHEGSLNKTYSMIIDKRKSLKHHRTNHQVAFALYTVLGTHINKLDSKADKINFLTEITGRSGNDLYNNLNGQKHLTKSERDQIEQRLNVYKLK